MIALALDTLNAGLFIGLIIAVYVKIYRPILLRKSEDSASGQERPRPIYR